MAETNVIMSRQGQYKKKSSRKNEIYLAKMNPNGYCWTHGWRVTKVHSSYTEKQTSTDTGKETHVQELWEDQITTRIGYQRDG